MGTVIAIVSGKGGTGKTTLTAGIASALAESGFSVLCIDLDIGLRNLDIALAMTDCALMDFTDVISGRCPLSRAAAAHPDIANLSLLTAPVTPDCDITAEGLGSLLEQARKDYDYILLDAPAGIGPYFQLAVSAADRTVVISNSEPSALRDAQHTASRLREKPVHLIVNRVRRKLLHRMRTTIDEAMDLTGLPLLGVVPEDSGVLLAENSGVPLLKYETRGAAKACRNIARRLSGIHTPVMKM